MVGRVFIAMSVAVLVAVSAVPAHAITAQQFQQAALLRVAEIQTEIEVLLSQQPFTPAIRREIRALQATSRQLRSLSRVANRRPEQVLQRFADYYQLAVSHS